MSILLWWLPPITATAVAIAWLVASGERDRRARGRAVSGRATRRRASELKRMGDVLARPLPAPPRSRDPGLDPGAESISIKRD